MAEILGGAMDSATLWPLASKNACMYDGPTIPGIDLPVKLDIGRW
jgi:hypothetical protein